MGTIIFINLLMKYSAWKLIAISLILQAVHTCILYANVERWTVAWGLTDWTVNLTLMLFNQSVFICLAVLPMTIKMMYVIPQNIEASMFAIITACLTFSSDWGGDMLGAALCQSLNITSEDMSQYSQAIQVKLILLLVTFILVFILPSDEDLLELSKKFNQKQEAEQHFKGALELENTKIQYI